MALPLLIGAFTAITAFMVCREIALGAGMLVGGLLFYISGNMLSKRVKEAWKQVAKEAEEVSSVCSYLSDLEGVCSRYNLIMSQADRIYKRQLLEFLRLAAKDKKKDWNFYNDRERKLIQNTALLVAL